MRALLGALAVAGSAAAVEPPDLVENDDKWGLVEKMVEPKLTAAERQQVRGGYVDVRARLTPTGALIDASVEADRAETNVVLEPLREVLPRWRFRTPSDENCLPARQPVHFRILFEGGRYHTQMRVLHEKEPPAHGPDMRVIHREPPRYPRVMLRAAHTGVTFSRLEIAPDGHVVGAETRPYGDGMGEVELRVMAEAVHKAVVKWQFSPIVDGPELERMRTSCHTMRFNIVD
jgi:hypothetical protein